MHAYISIYIYIYMQKVLYITIHTYISPMNMFVCTRVCIYEYYSYTHRHIHKTIIHTYMHIYSHSYIHKHIIYTIIHACMHAYTWIFTIIHAYIQTYGETTWRIVLGECTRFLWDMIAVSHHYPYSLIFICGLVFAHLSKYS